MYKNSRIMVVVPAYNEETQIGRVIETMPELVDVIVIVDDKSKDNTIEVIKKYQETHPKIILLCHAINEGVGGAIATGYEYARDNNADVAVVMAGDGQMDPTEIVLLLDPVIDENVNYVKGNRLTGGKAYEIIPKVRYFGNSILSLLTKIASGYWHVVDSQTGYTAINKQALHAISWQKMYKRYGQPNDLLVMLNVENFSVRDVPIKPIYNVGEKSGIKVRKVIFTISWLLLKRFFWRLKEKYVIRDFHPLVFFYLLGFSLLILGAAFFINMLIKWPTENQIPEISMLCWMFCFVSGMQSLFFAMWFDMECNKELR